MLATEFLSQDEITKGYVFLKLKNINQFVYARETVQNYLAQCREKFHAEWCVVNGHDDCSYEIVFGGADFSEVLASQSYLEELADLRGLNVEFNLVNKMLDNTSDNVVIEFECSEEVFSRIYKQLERVMLCKGVVVGKNKVYYPYVTYMLTDKSIHKIVDALNTCSYYYKFDKAVVKYCKRGFEFEVLPREQGLCLVRELSEYVDEETPEVIAEELLLADKMCVDLGCYNNNLHLYSKKQIAAIRRYITKYPSIHLSVGESIPYLQIEQSLNKHEELFTDDIVYLDFDDREVYYRGISDLDFITYLSYKGFYLPFGCLSYLKDEDKVNLLVMVDEDDKWFTRTTALLNLIMGRIMEETKNETR